MLTSKQFISLLTAGALSFTLSSCAYFTKEQSDETLDDKNPFEEEYAYPGGVKKDDVDSGNHLIKSEKIIENIIEVDPNAPLTTDGIFVKEENIPFTFTYLHSFDEEGNPLYAKIGDPFIEKTINGKKVLYDSHNTECLSGYAYLQNPFYWQYFTPLWDGYDKASGYCGWVIPVFKEDGTFSLVDFDDFSCVLTGCRVNEDIIEKYASDPVEASFPISCFYVPCLDGLYGDGMASIIEKDEVLYLVSASNYEMVYAKGFSDIQIGSESDPYIELFYPNGQSEKLYPNNIHFISSDVLKRVREK